MATSDREVLFTLFMGEPAMEDIEIMKEIMLEMKETMLDMNRKMARTEEDLSFTKNQLAVDHTDLVTAKDELAATKDELATTKDELATTKTALMEVELEVARVREPPFIHACGSHYDRLSIKSGTIPYSSLLYSSTNQETGGLDTQTGVFTAPHPGSYTVTWSTMAADDYGEHYVHIYLYKNGQGIVESKHYSRYTGPSGWVGEQGKYYSVIILLLLILLQEAGLWCSTLTWERL